MSEFTQAHELNNMVPGPAGTSVVRVMYKSEDGVLECYGTTVPTDGNVFAVGCIFHKVDASANETIYVNNGTYASPSFERLATSGAAFVADDGGPSPLIWDGVDVLGVMLNPASGYYFFTDLFEGDLTSGASLWTLTMRSSGTITNSVEQGGGVIIDAGAATAGQGVTLQMHGISIKPEPGTTIRIEWRCKIDEDDGRLVMGLGAVGTTDWVADDSIVVNADCALFVRDDGTTATKWSTQICDGSSAQEVADEFTSDTGYETFGIKIVGDGSDADDSVTFYHNGVAGSSTTDVADMPDAVMVPTFESNADGTDQPVLVIDWIKILVTNSSDGSRA